MLAEALLVSFGCVIAGHAATTDKALGLVETVAFDIGLLDISLREGSSFGVADALAEKGIPYIFVTAHGRDRLTGGHTSAPLIQKPYEADGLRFAIRQGLGLAVSRMTEQSTRVETDDAPTASPEDRFPIAGVGASAGGVQALTGFFKGIAEDCGVGIVIVTHLNPDRPSLLHEVLRNVSVLPVEVASDGVRVEKNRVYVMPENVVIGLKGRALTVQPSKVPRDHKPIDAFFESMAAEIGDCAIGVVLSGGDGDGTLGVKAITARGGLTFAQEPGDGASSPLQSSMPESAIATGMINFILPVEAMGRRLAILARGGVAPKPRPPPSSFFRDPLAVRNHDFSGYKRKSFQRGGSPHEIPRPQVEPIHCAPRETSFLDCSTKRVLERRCVSGFLDAPLVRKFTRSQSSCASTPSPYLMRRGSESSAPTSTRRRSRSPAPDAIFLP